MYIVLTTSHIEQMSSFCHFLNFSLTYRSELTIRILKNFNHYARVTEEVYNDEYRMCSFYAFLTLIATFAGGMQTHYVIG